MLSKTRIDIENSIYLYNVWIVVTHFIINLMNITVIQVYSLFVSHDQIR